MTKKAQLIQEIQRLHKDYRAWHRLVYGERLDTDLMQRMTTQELNDLIKEIKKGA